MNAILDHHAAGADSALADLEKLWADYVADENDATRKAFVDAADALALAPYDVLAAAAAQTERGAAQLALALHHCAKANTHRGTTTVDRVSRKDWQAIEFHQQAAEPLLRRAIELRFAPGMALAALMRREQINGSRSAAERLFDEVLEIAPRWLPAWRSIQGVREPRWGGTVKDMDALLDIAPKHLATPDVAILSANHWWWRANYTSTWDDDAKAALPMIERGLALDVPPRIRAWLLDEKGAILSRMDRDAEAAQVTREAVALEPADAEYHHHLAQRLRWSGNLDAAAGAYADGAALDGEHAYECARALGDLYAYDSKTEGVPRDRTRAVGGYERARELAADDATRARCLNWIGLEWSEVEPHDYARADTAFAQAAALGDRYAARNLALMLKRTHADDADAQRRVTELLTVAASGGSVASMRDLAERHEAGTGCSADAQASAAWRRKAAVHGDVASLGAQADAHAAERDAARAEAAAWLAMAESGSDTVPVRVLVNALLEGRYGNADHVAALGIVQQVLGSEERADADLAISKTVLDYNALAPKQRDPKSTLAALRSIRKTVDGYIKSAQTGKGEDHVVAYAKLHEARFRALSAELGELIRTMPGNTWGAFFWNWFGGPLRWIINMFRGARAWPAIRRPNWQ